jgi:metal-responsive CopG/Arc/MetJ family transcriptional regulator
MRKSSIKRHREANTERVQATLRPGLARRLDEAVEQQSMSRSTFVRQAVAEKLARAATAEKASQ